MKLGPLTILFLIFMILKLAHQITWSWIWVFAPLWMGIPVVFIIVLGALAFAAIVVKK